MKITVVSFDNWGFNKFLVQKLNEIGYDAHHIDFSKSGFRYRNLFYRIQNFLSKTFQKRDLKRVFYARYIEGELKKLSKQDLVLYIKADFIAPEFIPQLKSYSEKSIAFFNDSSDRCPKIKKVHHLFDRSFSFEKKDCELLNMEFKTNFMYFDEKEYEENQEFDYKVFNVSSWDKRSAVLNKIADFFSEKNITFLFYVFSKEKQRPSNFNAKIEFINRKISLEEIDKYIEKTECMLDISRNMQEGLTFRVFESLGKNKKLVTTNVDVVNYPFYNPQNIFVINPELVQIPDTFLNSNFEPMSKETIYPYTTAGWLETLLSEVNDK